MGAQFYSDSSKKYKEIARKVVYDTVNVYVIVSSY